MKHYMVGKCRTPIYWDEVGERNILGTNYVQIVIDKIWVVMEKLKIAQDKKTM